MAFSATEASFEGFRVTRARPLAVLAWAGVWLIGLIVMIASMAPLLVGIAPELEGFSGDASTLSAGAQTRLLLVMALSIPFTLAIQAILVPAVYRAVLRPEERSLAGLRLGKDELRLLGVTLILLAISLCVSLIGGLAEQAALSAGGVIARSLVSGLVLALTIVITVRLCLMAPHSFVAGKIQLRPAVKLTTGNFWPLLGMTVLSTVMAIVVALLLTLVAWPLVAVMGLGGGTPTAAGGAAALGLVGLLALGMALVSTIAWAPIAVAYRDITGMPNV